MLGGLEKALLAVLVLVLMTGMGATLTWSSFVAVARRPRGLLVGLASQFGWMPLIAFGLASALSLPPELAIGLVIIGCTPGGTTSNLFTYYARADLALSIAMTSVSTVVAVVAMPLVLALYAAPFTGAELAIPYGSIVKTLAVVLVPVALGIWIRSRSERVARLVERSGSIAGVLVLALLIGSALVRNADLLLRTTAIMHASALGLGLLGMTLGAAAARGLGLTRSQVRAVSLETGIQNSPLAFAIIIASFPDALHQQLLWLPMLYALYVLIVATGVTFVFRQSAGGALEPLETPAAQG